MFWQNVYPQLCHLLSFKISTVVTKSTFANNFSLKNGAAPDLFLGHIFHAVCRAHHWKWVTSAHVRAVEFSFPANILCHFKVSSGLEHDCTFIGSSEEFSVESVRINHSSISGEADKPVRNKPKAKDRTLYKLAYELLCIPQTQWIQENRQVFITIFMHRIKHLLQTENSIFFSSFLGCHLKLKQKKHLSQKY